MNYILLGNGFEEIEAISVIDILRRASIDLEVVSINKNKEVKSDRGLNVVADTTIKDIKKEVINSIILPGGSGYKNLENSENVKDLINYSIKNEKYIFSICAAPSILGNLGLLSNKNATCYPGFEKYLKNANLKKEPVVVDGNLITSRGPGTAHLFALKIVELLKNKSLADEIKSGMLFD